MSSALHSIAFPKNYKLNDMISFLNNNNIKPIKPIDVYQPNYNRVRVRDPKLFDHFTTKILPDGIHLIIGWYKSMKGGASNKPKKIYYGAQRDLKKTERRPTQTEAWQAHQIRYWGLNQIHEGLRQQGLPTPKKLLKELDKYKNMDLIKNPDKVEKYYKFIDDKEAKLKEAENNLMKEQERLKSEEKQLLEEENILKKAKAKAATKIQSLFRKKKAMKELKALKKAKIEATKKKDVTLETLTDKAKSIIYNAIYLVPYEYRRKFEELIPRIKLSKGYEYPRFSENMFKSPDELVPIMDEIYNENNLIANIKKLIY